MDETFPSAPRAPIGIRVLALSIGLIGLLVAARTTAQSLRWVDRPFPGFFVLVTRVVPSIGLGHWSGSSVQGLYQSQVTAVDGRPVSTADDVYDYVLTKPVGTPVRYRLLQSGSEREVIIPTQLFGPRDWTLLFGAFLLNAAVYLVSGIVAWVLRPGSALSRAALAFGITFSMFFLTAMNIYGPGTLTRLHTVTEALMPAASLQLFMLLPQEHAWSRWRHLGYVPGLLLFVAYQLFMDRPAAFSTVLIVNMLFLGSAGLFFCWRLVSAYLFAASRLARERVRILAVGTLLGMGIPAALLVLSSVGWGRMAMNGAAFPPAIFALALAYAIVKHDVLEIDAMLKRGAFYLLLTGCVGAAYVAAAVVFNSVLSANVVTSSPLFPVLFTLAVLLVFNPVRTRIQALVDRLFFRTQYDSAEVLARVSTDLTTARAYDRIAGLVEEHVQRAIPNTATRLFTGPSADALGEIGGARTIHPGLARHLAAGRIVTSFDSPESYANEAEHEATMGSLQAIEAELAVPLCRDGVLVGVLTLGPKRSGLFYTAGDADVLHAIAQQAVIALANAESYQALADLNASLEARVRERTAQLEEANTELTRAYGDLKTAQVQLVHSAKMASLGRLVAGVAHEINNPVSFIAGSVAPLRRRLAKAAEIAPEPVKKVLSEADELTAVMARGAERTAAIVKDLRTFSRLDEATRKPVDLLEGLEVSVRLLAPRWRDRITIHRALSPLPPVEGDPGQLNQVLVNVLANACDAIPANGNIWLASSVDDGFITLAIRDDGVGMPDEVRQRIFEPFFTTKDVGSGSGLGLAISYNVMANHGGRIEVESAPGEGSTVRLVLPVSTSQTAAMQSA